MLYFLYFSVKGTECRLLGTNTGRVRRQPQVTLPLRRALRFSIKMVMKIKIMKETLYENSKIPELLNPWVNSVFCGANSRVVTKEGKLITLKEYQEKI